MFFGSHQVFVGFMFVAILCIGTMLIAELIVVPLECSANSTYIYLRDF